MRFFLEGGGVGKTPEKRSRRERVGKLTEVGEPTAFLFFAPYIHSDKRAEPTENRGGGDLNALPR